MKLHITLIFILIFSFSIFGQTKNKQRRSPNKKYTTSGIITDSRALNDSERKYCLSILKILDTSDAILGTAKDPYRFKETIHRAVGLIVDADKNMREGSMREALQATTLAYMDTAVLMELGATRHTQGSVEISDEQAENLGEIKRRYSSLFNTEALPDLLDEENVAAVYTHAFKMKEALYGLIKQ